MSTYYNAKIQQYITHLQIQEKSEHTIEKYERDIRRYLRFAGARAFEENCVLEYKSALAETYQSTSVNSMLAALNGFFVFCARPELRVKPLRIQRQVFARADRELTQEEYQRLVRAAQTRGKERLSLILQTICATGIRISELKYITVEAVQRGSAEVACKNKHRRIIIVPKLKKLLLSYAKKQGVRQGAVFISRRGAPLSRHRVWADMKNLCKFAQVDAKKVFPHNLRHLFARTFYAMRRDIGHLADILGHSNINTTRIYTMETMQTHLQIMKKLPLLI